MSETIDLFNNCRFFVRTIEKGSIIRPGENKVSVHVWIMNSKSEFLLQQRTPFARKFPNMWSQTGGGAQSGETSWACCVRESLEEIGIQPDADSSIFIGTFKRPMDFVDVWLVYNDTPLSELSLQPEEVQNVKWASLEEIEEMQSDGVFIPYILPGLNMVKNYLSMEKLFSNKS